MLAEMIRELLVPLSLLSAQHVSIKHKPPSVTHSSMREWG